MSFFLLYLHCICHKGSPRVTGNNQIALHCVDTQIWVLITYFYILLVTLQTLVTVNGCMLDAK